jgi:hypothetical protein
MCKSPIYTWQFADKNVPRRRFKFPRVYQAINKYIELWKGLKSPDITGFCPKCQIKDACLGWYFARAEKLAEEEIVRRKAASKLSRTVLEEIADTDRRNVYVSFGDAKERDGDRWAVQDIIYILFSIFYYRQKIYKDFEKEISFWW